MQRLKPLAVADQDSLRTVYRCNRPRQIVILVHGTWASNAEWTGPNSPMVRALRLRLDPNTTDVHALDWSGRNSPRARREAAVFLNKYLNQLNLEFVDVPITLVAHSHGGNIALTALAIAQVNNASVVCLSTPFLRTQDSHRCMS